MTQRSQTIWLFVGLLYVFLNIATVVFVMGFDYYEPKFGGPSESLFINAVLNVPLTLAIGVGYAAVVMRGSVLAPLERTWWRVVLAALICAALEFLPSFVSFLLTALSFALRVGVLIVYWLVLGAFVAFLGLAAAKRDTSSQGRSTWERRAK